MDGRREGGELTLESRVTAGAAWMHEISSDRRLTAWTVAVGCFDYSWLWPKICGVKAPLNDSQVDNSFDGVFENAVRKK